MYNFLRNCISPKTRNELSGYYDLYPENLKRLFLGKWKGHRASISTYWCPGTRNFGDLITPLLLEHYNITPILSVSPNLEISIVGSILEMLPEGFKGTIFGSGFMHENSVRDLSRCKVLAVRGKLTRNRLGGDEKIALGDPGLLLRNIYQKQNEKSVILGLIPHWRDMDDPRLHDLQSRYIGKIKILNVCNKNVLDVVSEIDKCEHIISSSLHGVIMADMLGIPNNWTILSSKVEGSGYKFRDYYSAFGIDRKPSEVNPDETLASLLTKTFRPPESLTELSAHLLEKWEDMIKKIG